MSEEQKLRISEAGRARSYFARAYDREVPLAVQNIYGTYAYKDARRRIIKNRPCLHCGATKRIHAHHTIPGDNESLVPLCAACHKREHCRLDGIILENVKGRTPPPGEQPPLCQCGCGTPVNWKRVRGWGTHIRGHGNAVVPAGTQKQEAPLCACGCKEPVKFRHGKGWNEYKRGHGQRIIGHYSQRE